MPYEPYHEKTKSSRLEIFNVETRKSVYYNTNGLLFQASSPSQVNQIQKINMHVQWVYASTMFGLGPKNCILDPRFGEKFLCPEMHNMRYAE